MGFFYANPNPLNQRVGDCVIRAISLATGESWKRIYQDLSAYGYRMADMPSSNAVWGTYLKDKGFRRRVVNDPCPDGCYTVRDFCRDNPDGVYILGTGTHTVCVKFGDYLDTWDSGDEVPMVYWERR